MEETCSGASSSVNPPTPAALALTPITDGAKPGQGKKRQRPQTTPGGSGQSAEQTLRTFSLSVCNIVQTKGETTYAAVADTLVEEMLGPEKPNDADQEGRNIRRSALFAAPRTQNG